MPGLVMPGFMYGVVTIVPPVLWRASHWPAAATRWLSNWPADRSLEFTAWTVWASSITPATMPAMVAASAGADRVTAPRRGRERTIRPMPKAATTDSGAPRSRSKRCGNPSTEARLPRYISTHQPTTVATVSTSAGRRR